MSQKNKIVAVQKPGMGGMWYAAIECGPWSMIPASMDFFKSKENGWVYKWYLPILDPPADLQPYQEIMGGIEQFFDIKAVAYEEAYGFEQQELLVVELLRRMGRDFNLSDEKVQEYLDKLNKEATDGTGS